MIIRLLGPSDAELLRQPAKGVFDFPPQPRWTAEFLNDPRHHMVAAIDNGKIVGFVSAVHYLHPDKAPELWINEVAVAPAFQNQGVGRRMLAQMLAQAFELGCVNAWVLTDRDNLPAMRLYKAVGGIEAMGPTVMLEFAEFLL